ncbi:MAG: DUF4199 domain-containing protein [Bacteroidales bacterium]|nr:DUF4199 domain-containing protein [Bacteroidales bacterium]
MKIFHRYHSTIHGNYRRAYLRCGLIAGVVLMLYILVRYLMGRPAESPEAYLSDGILLLSVVLFTLLYRNALSERKASLKELMLFGTGLSVVASVLYGLFVWLFGMAAPAQTVLFTFTMRGQEIAPDDPQIGYWAALWGIVAGVKLAILGSFGAFFSALLFRTEKAPTV